MFSEPSGNGKPKLLKALPEGPLSCRKATEADAAQGFAKRPLSHKMKHKQKLLRRT